MATRTKPRRFTRELRFVKTDELRKICVVSAGQEILEQLKPQPFHRLWPIELQDGLVHATAEVMAAGGFEVIQVTIPIEVWLPLPVSKRAAAGLPPKRKAVGEAILCRCGHSKDSHVEGGEITVVRLKCRFCKCTRFSNLRDPQKRARRDPLDFRLPGDFERGKRR
jgi:hypothetical protein